MYRAYLLIVASCSAWGCPDNLVARGTPDPAVLGRFRLVTKSRSTPTYKGPNTRQITWTTTGNVWLLSSVTPDASYMFYRSAPADGLFHCPSHVRHWEAWWMDTWWPSKLTFVEAILEEVSDLVPDREERGPDLCPSNIAARGTDDPILRSMFVMFPPAHVRPQFTDRNTNFIAWNASWSRWVVALVTPEATQVLYRATTKQSLAYCPTDVLKWEVADGGKWKPAELLFVKSTQTEIHHTIFKGADHFSAIRLSGSIDVGLAVVGVFQPERKNESAVEPLEENRIIWPPEFPEIGSWRGQTFLRRIPIFKNLNNQVLVWTERRWWVLTVDDSGVGGKFRRKWYRAEDVERQFAWSPTYVRNWQAFVKNEWVPSNLTLVHVTGDGILHSEENIMQKVASLFLDCAGSVDVVVPDTNSRNGDAYYKGTFIKEATVEAGYLPLAYRGELNNTTMHLFYNLASQCWTLGSLWASVQNQDCPEGVTLHRLDASRSDTLYVSETCPDIVRISSRYVENSVSPQDLYYFRARVERDPQNAQRPIYRSVGGRFLFWWQDWNSWAISDEYRDHTHNPLYLGKRTESPTGKNYFLCPTDGEFFAASPGVWRYEGDSVSLSASSQKETHEYYLRMMTLYEGKNHEPVSPLFLGPWGGIKGSFQGILCGIILHFLRKRLGEKLTYMIIIIACHFFLIFWQSLGMAFMMMALDFVTRAFTGKLGAFTGKLPAPLRGPSSVVFK